MWQPPLQTDLVGVGSKDKEDEAYTPRKICRVDPGAQDEPKSFGDKLAACNGVLKPPRVGDSGLVEPTPDVGKTPVIRPGELLEQHGSKP